MAGLYRALAGLAGPPLTEVILGRAWRERSGHLRAIIDRVTAELTPGKIMPFGDDEWMTHRRYVLVGPDGRGPFLAVGLRRGKTMSRACPCSPLARGTRGAADVSERLTTAPLGSHAVDTGDGHVWVRLQPPLGIPIADVVASLVGTCAG